MPCFHFAKMVARTSLLELLLSSGTNTDNARIVPCHFDLHRRSEIRLAGSMLMGSCITPVSAHLMYISLNGAINNAHMAARGLMIESIRMVPASPATANTSASSPGNFHARSRSLAPGEGYFTPPWPLIGRTGGRRRAARACFPTAARCQPVIQLPSPALPIIGLAILSVMLLHSLYVFGRKHFGALVLCRSVGRSVGLPSWLDLPRKVGKSKRAREECTCLKRPNFPSLPRTVTESATRVTIYVSG